MVSFGRKHLPWILDYIGRQREHHAAGRVHQRLEVFEPDEKGGTPRREIEKPG